MNGKHLLISGILFFSGAIFANAWLDGQAPVGNSDLSKTTASETHTGQIVMTLAVVPPEGWVMVDDGSIGSQTSGATNRANHDTFDLYVLLWNNLGQEVAVVAGGRGASAEDDFHAGKALTLPPFLGRTLAVANPTAQQDLSTSVLGDLAGTETHVLTVEEMPQHTHTVGEISDGNHLAAADKPIVPYAAANRKTVRTGPAGMSQPHNIMQPTLYVNMLIKL